MKKIKNWLPMVLIILATMFLTGCTVDWSTVSATETNGFAVGAFWTLVHIIIPVILFLGFTVLLSPSSYSYSLEEGSVVSRWILGFALIGIYVFHFWHMKAPWFNLSCLTQLGLLALSFVIFNMALYDEFTDFESIIYTFVSIGIVIVSLLANVYTGKFLEPFVFSCAGWLSIILGSVGREIRDDIEGAEILSPILCLAFMIFGVVHADVPNYLYMCAIQCSIATLFTMIFIASEDMKVLSFAVSVLCYIWVFIAGNMYNPESFGKSLGTSFIGWGAIIAISVLGYIIVVKKAEKERERIAAYNAQRAKDAYIKEAKEKAEAEKAKAEKAEAEAKAKAEAEAKAKAEAEAKAKQLAEIQPTLQKLESELEAKKAEAASLASDAQGIMKKAKLNKEIKELEPQIETLKAEVERLSK
ncbi:MAG: hypothetical protein J5978_03820 [Spirochaetaceae bacterium]|nr:hypothetical protein [Spirochaetaceae bacterium]